MECYSYLEIAPFRDHLINSNKCSIILLSLMRWLSCTKHAKHTCFIVMKVVFRRDAKASVSSKRNILREIVSVWLKQVFINLRVTRTFRMFPTYFFFFCTFCHFCWHRWQIESQSWKLTKWLMMQLRLKLRSP